MDDTAVANQCLQAIGTRSSIAGLSEASTEGYAVNLIYGLTRDELLRKIPWNWARRQAYLAVWKAAQGTPENPQGATNDPPLPWIYSYAYPSDCLKARLIVPIVNNTSISGIPLTTSGGVFQQVPKSPPVRFIEAGDQDASGNPIKVILTNFQQAQLVYTARITDPNIWDALFVTALIGRLAAKLVFALAGDKSLAKMAMESGAQAELEAAASNGNEAGVRSVNVVPDWIQGRDYIDETDSDVYGGNGILTDDY